MRYRRVRPPPSCALFTYRAALAPPSAGHAAKLGLCRKTSAAEGVETGTEMRMTEESTAESAGMIGMLQDSSGNEDECRQSFARTEIPRGITAAM